MHFDRGPEADRYLRDRLLLHKALVLPDAAVVLFLLALINLQTSHARAPNSSQFPREEALGTASDIQCVSQTRARHRGREGACTHTP
eukprot:3744799-Rhodomonas_salina.1